MYILIFHTKMWLIVINCKSNLKDFLWFLTFPGHSSSPANLLRLKYNLPGSHHVFSIWTSNIYCSRTSKLIPHAKWVYIKINLLRSSVRLNYEKSIFSTTVTTLNWWRIWATKTKIKRLCNILYNINSINNYHTFRTFGNKINILFENHLIGMNSQALYTWKCFKKINN